jgi:hypothetical protein
MNEVYAFIGAEAYNINATRKENMNVYSTNQMSAEVMHLKHLLLVVS